jgi:hypothetical protein
MSLSIPPDLETLFLITTGERWPHDADEDRLRELSEVTYAWANSMAGTEERIRAAAALALKSWRGQSADEFSAMLAPLLESDGIGKLIEHARQLARTIRQISFEIEYTKRIIIAQFVIFMALVAWLIPMLWFPFTAGWAASMIAAMTRMFQVFVQTAWRRLLFSIGIGLLYQLGPDIFIQLDMLRRHPDYKWDGQKTGVAALAGVIGGVLGPFMQTLGGAFLSNRALSSFPWLVGNNAFIETGTEAIVDEIASTWNDNDGRKHTGLEWSAVAGAMEGVRDWMGHHSRGMLFNPKSLDFNFDPILPPDFDKKGHPNDLPPPATPPPGGNTASIGDSGSFVGPPPYSPPPSRPPTPPPVSVTPPPFSEVAPPSRSPTPPPVSVTPPPPFSATPPPSFSAQPTPPATPPLPPLPSLLYTYPSPRDKA